jgi:hypothetical protein
MACKGSGVQIPSAPLSHPRRSTRLKLPPSPGRLLRCFYLGAHLGHGGQRHGQPIAEDRHHARLHRRGHVPVAGADHAAVALATAAGLVAHQLVDHPATAHVREANVDEACRIGADALGLADRQQVTANFRMCAGSGSTWSRGATRRRSGSWTSSSAPSRRSVISAAARGHIRVRGPWGWRRPSVALMWS